MGEFRNDCCDPNPDCCCRPQNDCCNNDSGSIWGILILLAVLYFLFCGNNDRGGGLFGGLF
ncbi:Uncharacterised protein [uncultured Eubacterium sp.]|uniref:hypothetical protein n=1 Tax=Emergencia sp. TaxID=1926557 RepID=UPI00082090FE|nr:Uncharacterised protein [uncultured Eubacterium sp.]